MTGESNSRTERSRIAARSVLFGIAANLLLALTKGTAGYFGNAYALIADAIESLSDVFSSLAVYLGLRIAAAPPSETHPYGRGKAEALAAALVSLALFAAAILIVVQSIHEIKTPHSPPAPYTLAVLLGVIAVKELLFRKLAHTGATVQSSAVRAEAWHHRSDAVTSLAAGVGITIALIGGPGYESADDWAALVASCVIAFTAVNILRPALRELTDAAPESEISLEIRAVAAGVPGVLGTHRCYVRKHGFDYYVDLDILVEGSIPVREGHDLAHAVQRRIREVLPFVQKVLVHVEPVDKHPSEIAAAN